MNMKDKTATLASGLVLLATLLSPVTPHAAAGSFSEPYTIFYGKVLGTGSAQDYLITEGTLQWTIQRSDGVEIDLETALFALGDGAFSYRLHVPHSAFALGLEAGTGEIPLPPQPTANMHARMRVDGELASPLGPASTVFTTAQLLRTATYRMDLAVGREAPDTDGDGIPDWWEDVYGLDKQDASDATVDANGDGLSALEAYRRGWDPTLDLRVPVVLTEEQLVYATGSTAILLDTADLDSAPEQLTYTLSQLDLAGTLTMRNARQNPDEPDRILAVGDTFTQADLLRGRVVYDHDGSETEPGTMQLVIRDEQPEHAVSQAASVRLLAFRPAESAPPEMPALEARRQQAAALAADGYVVADASGLPGGTAVANPSAGLADAELTDYRAAYGDDRPYVLIGGRNAVELTGGHRDDRLVASSPDGTLTGGMGADRFVFEQFEHGLVTITDFTPVDGDVIDFSALSLPSGASANNYLRLAGVEGGVELQVALSGDETGFTNLVVALPGIAQVAADLYGWVAAGTLEVGSLRLEPVLTIMASEPDAFRNGPTPGRFTVTRAGDLSMDLTVNLSISGTASNGEDYEWIGSSLTFPAGVSVREIALMPYATDYQGPEKIARLQLEPGTGYRVGLAASAMITIANLSPRIELDVLEPVAVMVDNTPAVVRLSRRDVTSGDTIVRLAFGGAAVAGVDYETLPSVVVFAAGETAKLLEVVPIYNVLGSGSVKALTITVAEDADYVILPGAGAASVSVDQTGVPVMAPASGQVLETRRPTFVWPPVANASWYQLWIQREGSTYDSPWVEGAASWTPPRDMPAGTYTWWVRGWSPAGYSAWSAPATFVIPVQQPGLIAQISPEGLEPDRNLVFRWDQTDRRATWFRLWVSHPEGGTWLDQWVQATAADEAAVAQANHPGGHSTWWLRGWGPDGYGPWSGPMAFETPEPVSVKPVLTAPLGVTTAPVTLTYQAEGVQWFRVYVSRDGTRVLDTWTQGSSYAAGNLASGSYAWWVGAWNPDRGETVWSDRKEFLVP